LTFFIWIKKSVYWKTTWCCNGFLPCDAL